MNVYHSVSREQIENYLFRLTMNLIMGVVEEKSVGTNLKEEDKLFIANFYKYSFVGVMLDWIKMGMRADYQEIVEKMCLTLRGNIMHSIRNFSEK